MLAQHVKLVHAPKQDEGTRGRVERADDLGDDVGDDLGDEKGSAGSNHYIYGIEGADWSGEEDDGDGELAAKEKELADKEAELRDYERIVEQSEEEAAKARENLLRDRDAAGQQLHTAVIALRCAYNFVDIVQCGLRLTSKSDHQVVPDHLVEQVQRHRLQGIAALAL